MMCRWKLIMLAAVAIAAAGSRLSAAQQVAVYTPFRQVNEGFFERIGISWGFNAPGISFTFNNAGLAQPPFGGYDPRAGMQTAFFVGRPGGTNAWFNIEAAQGFRRSLVAQTPAITLMNGQPGFFADTSLTPFVISYIPVVGCFPPAIWFEPSPAAFTVPDGNAWEGGPGSEQTNPLTAALRQHLAQGRAKEEIWPLGQREGVGQGVSGGQDSVLSGGVPRSTRTSPEAVQPAQRSSAALAAPSVAEARRLYAEEQSAAEQQAAALLERGRAAEAAGKPQVARVFYEMAARRAAGQLKQEALERLSALRDK